MICWDLMFPTVSVQRLKCSTTSPSSTYCLLNFLSNGLYWWPQVLIWLHYFSSEGCFHTQGIWPALRCPANPKHTDGEAADFCLSPGPVSVPVPLETGQMTNVLTTCFPSLLQQHLLSDAHSDVSDLDLPDLAFLFSSKPSVDPPGSTNIIDSRRFHLTYRSH
jgi:hypothetical protein